MENNYDTTLISEEDMETVFKAVNALVDICHGRAAAAGWWTNPKTGEPADWNFGEKVALMHSELSEALEGNRKNRMDDHLPHRSSVEVEFADTVIRICDVAGKMGLDLGGAIREKLEYNANRADHKLENRLKAGGKAY